MSKQKKLAMPVALTCAGAATLAQPDRLHLVIGDQLLCDIAKALAALAALQVANSRITIPLGTTDGFTASSEPWPSGDRKDGRFAVSSVWLHVEPQRLHIEVWESYGDDVLHGFVEFAQLPTLRDALKRQRRASEEELLQHLCTPLASGVPEPSPAACANGLTAVLARALRLSEPWLVTLGDYIGNGTPQDPTGRCDAVLAVRRALDRLGGQGS